MESLIQKQEDGSVIFRAGVASFPVFADDMVKTVGQLDALSDASRQAILLTKHLPVDPWMPEVAKPILMGIVQNAWYEFFKGEVPEKIMHRQRSREIDYPKMLKVTEERRQAAIDKAAKTKALKDGKPVPTAEELEAKRKAKDAAKFAKDKAKAEREAARATKAATKDADKAQKLAERELAKQTKLAEKAAGISVPAAPRAPRTPKTPGVRKYQLVQAQKTVWSAYLGQKQIIVQAMVALKGPATAQDIAGKCSFENSRQTALSVVGYYMNNLKSAGVIEEVPVDGQPTNA